MTTIGVFSSYFRQVRLVPMLLFWLFGGSATLPTLQAAAPPSSRQRPVFELWGHREIILGVRFSPDGNWLATIDKKIAKLWDLRTGKAVHSLTTGYAFPGALFFSPDSSLLVVSGDSKKKIGWPTEVQVWSVRTGKCLRVLNCFGRDQALAFSPDGKILASGGYRIKIWDTTTWKVKRSLPSSPGGDVHGLVFSLDGKQIALINSFLNDGSIFVCDATTGARVAFFNRFNGGVDRVRFSLDGKRLTSWHSDLKLRRWDLVHGKLLSAASLRLPSGEFNSINLSGKILPYTWSADRKQIGAIDTAGSVMLWDAATLKLLWKLPMRYVYTDGKPRDELHVRFSPDGRWLVTGVVDWAVEVWDLRSIVKPKK